MRTARLGHEPCAKETPPSAGMAHSEAIMRRRDITAIGNAQERVRCEQAAFMAIVLGGVSISPILSP
jgi:hypothetical protein